MRATERYSWLGCFGVVIKLSITITWVTCQQSGLRVTSERTFESKLRKIHAVHELSVHSLRGIVKLRSVSDLYEI